MSADERNVAKLVEMGLTIEEIATSTGFSVEDLEVILKNNVKIGAEVAKSNNSKALAMIDEKFKSVLPSALCVAAEMIQDETVKSSVRKDLIKFVIEQQLGMMVPKQTNIQINIGEINNRMEAVRKRKEEMEKRAIDVGSQAVAA